MAREHRIERITNKLVERMHDRKSMIARELLGKDERPPFTEKLSEREQLEIYYAMTPEKWQAFRDQYGAKQMLKYSEAMLKLHEKLVGPVNPGVAIIGPGMDEYATLPMTEEPAPGTMMPGG